MLEVVVLNLLGVFSVALGVAIWAAGLPTGPTEEELEPEGQPVETWVNDGGPFDVIPLGWDEFRNLVTQGGRTSFAGNQNTYDRETACELGLPTWHERGNLWHVHDGQIYRCEVPGNTLGTTWT